MTAGKITHSESGATTFEGRSSAEASSLEPKTLDFFLCIAGEAVHWDRTPPIEGLYQFTNEQKGRFTHLKRCGLSPDFLHEQGGYPCQGARNQIHREALKPQYRLDDERSAAVRRQQWWRTRFE
jgi:hypothetical protein